MIRITFSASDLGQIRFAFSPLSEVVTSYRTLLDPSRQALHLRWVRETLLAIQNCDLSSLDVLLRSRTHFPDFLAPTPQTPTPAVEAGFKALRATPPEIVRKEVDVIYGRMADPPPALQQFFRDPTSALERLAQAVWDYWNVALAPHWPRMQALLEGDVLYRGRRLALGGPDALFGDLHADIGFRNGKLEINMKDYLKEVDLAGRGLLLIPGVFTWPGLYVGSSPDRQPTIAYSVRGLAGLWGSEPIATSDALAAALGRGRSLVMLNLDMPSTTVELAQRLAVTPGAISQHLRRLGQAGLVESRRSGRRVFYSLSPTGKSLLDLFQSRV